MAPMSPSDPISRVKRYKMAPSIIQLPPINLSEELVEKTEVFNLDKWENKKKYGRFDIKKSTKSSKQQEHEEENDIVKGQPKINQDMINSIMDQDRYSFSNTVEEKKIERSKNLSSLEVNDLEVAYKNDPTSASFINNIMILKEIASNKYRSQTKAKGKAKADKLPDIVMSSVSAFETLKAIFKNGGNIDCNKIASSIEKGEKSKVKEIQQFKNPYNLNKDSWKMIEKMIKLLETFDTKIALLRKEKDEIYREKYKIQLKLTAANNKLSTAGVRSKETRVNKRDVDIFEEARKRTLMGSMINHADIILATMSNLQETLNSINTSIEQKDKEVQAKKIQRDLLLDELIARLDYLLRNPEMISEVGLTISKVLTFKFKIGSVPGIELIGGDFSKPEKKYLIDLTKLKIAATMSKEKRKLINQQSFNTTYNSHDDVASILINRRTQFNIFHFKIYQRRQIC